MSQIICIGSSSKDIFFPTNEGVVLDTPEDITAQKKIAFELGAKYHIDNRFESLGGCAVNVACGLSRLGIKSFCYTALGNDIIGEWMKNEMEKEGIDTKLIKKENCLSGLSAIIVDKLTGERVIFSNQEANKNLKINKDELSDFKWISITDPSGNWKEILDDILIVAEKNKARIAFNPRGKNIVEDVKKVYEFGGKSEIFFINKDEAIEIVTKINEKNFEIDKINDEIFLLTELKKSGAKIVVITDGKRGAWGYDGLEIFHADSLEVEAIDSTGAGDSFSSGFLAGWIMEKSLEDSLKMGIANSASVVTHYGGVAGLLDKENINNFAEKVEVQRLN